MSKRGMTAKIPVLAVAAIGGVVVGYSLLSPSRPEIQHVIPVKHEVNKTIPVDSETEFNKVNLPAHADIRRAMPLHPPLASRRQPEQRLPNHEQVGILSNPRERDTPKGEDTKPESKKVIAGPQPKDGSSGLKPVEQYQANIESDDDDDDDDDE